MLLPFLSACDPAQCDGNNIRLDPQSPLIVHVGTLPLTAIPTFNKDPWAMVYSVDFLAPNADLSGGYMEIFVGDNTTPVQLPLSNLLRASELSPQSREGRLAVRWEFAPTIEDGTLLRLGFRLNSGTRKKSNCYVLDYSFNVIPATPR